MANLQPILLVTPYRLYRVAESVLLIVNLPGLLRRFRPIYAVSLTLVSFNVLDIQLSCPIEMQTP